MTQIMLEVSTTRLSKTLISHRHSRFHFQKRTLLTQMREIKLEIGYLRPTWMVQLVNPFQQEDVSTAELKFTNVHLIATVAMLSGNHVSSLVFLWLKPTLFLARFATKVQSENIGTITSKQLCTAHGARACRPNIDLNHYLCI